MPYTDLAIGIVIFFAISNKNVFILVCIYVNIYVIYVYIQLQTLFTLLDNAIDWSNYQISYHFCNFIMVFMITITFYILFLYIYIYIFICIYSIATLFTLLNNAIDWSNYQISYQFCNFIMVFMVTITFYILNSCMVYLSKLCLVWIIHLLLVTLQLLIHKGIYDSIVDAQERQIFHYFLQGDETCQLK